MDERTEKANHLLMNAKKLLESVRKSNCSDEDSFTCISLSLTPPLHKPKKLEINNDDECIVSPMTNNTNFNQSHDDITVDSSLFDADNQAESALETSSIVETKHIVTDLKSAGDFIHFMMSNTSVAVRPLRTEQSEENSGCDSTYNGVCIADHVRHSHSETHPQTISETKSSSKSCDKENTSPEKIKDILRSDETTLRKEKNDDNISTSRDDITVNFLQISEKDSNHVSVCYFQKGTLSFDQEKCTTTDRSIDSNTTETSQTNIEESCEDKTSSGTSSCHSPPSVHRRSSIISSSPESDLIRDLEFLSEGNWKLQCENMALRKDMNDFDGKLEILEETLGIINKVDTSVSESLDGNDECSEEHSRDIDSSCDDNIDDEKTTHKNEKDKHFAQFAPTSRDQRNPEPEVQESSQDAVIGARAPLHGLSSNHNISMPRRNSLDRNALTKEVSVLKENEKLMHSAIKSLHKCTTVHVRRHYDYRRMLKTCKKYESTDADLTEAMSKFHKYRAKFLLEKDKREELSHSVSDIVKKMNDLRRIIRQNIEEKQSISAHLDRLVDDCDLEVVDDCDYQDLSQSMELQMLREELKKSKEKNQALEESLRIVRQYMDVNDIDEEIIFEINRAAETNVP